MGNLLYLINHINAEIAEKKQIQLNLLNNIVYIDRVKEQLLNGSIQDIDVQVLQSIIQNIGIEEDEIFLQLKYVLEKFSIDVDDFINNISREKEIEFLLHNFQYLQEYAEFHEELEEEIVENYLVILIKIIESLYEKELYNIRNSEEYKKIDIEIKELESLLFSLKKQDRLELEEQDKIYKYIVNSNLENKINITLELSREWIERTKEYKKQFEESFIDSLIAVPLTSLVQEEQEEIEIVQENQREQLLQLTCEMTFEEWKEEIIKTVDRIKSKNIFTQQTKYILEKILLMCLNENLEELNMAKSVLSEYEDISLKIRELEYLNSSRFETNSIGVDLIMFLIPNLEKGNSSEIMQIIGRIEEKFKRTFLSKEELFEIKQLIENIGKNYTDITYIDYIDEKILNLESKFLEYNCEKEKLINYDKYNDNCFMTDEQYNDFVENTFKKFIKIKLNELVNLLENSEISGLVKRSGIDKLKMELEMLINNYDEFIILKQIKPSYKIYTLEEVEGLSFGNNNVIFFLRGESGNTLYEDGMFKNGQMQNGHMEIGYMKDLPKIIRNIYYNDKNLRTRYRHFKNDVQDNESTKSSKKPSDRGIPVEIAGRILERVSEPASKARVSIIKIDTIPMENRKKLGISQNNCVVLVLGSYEVNFNRESDTYGEMAKEARLYESYIRKIISALENPNTPKETLLQYIADSYGLLEYIICGSSQVSVNENQNGIGGRS